MDAMTEAGAGPKDFTIEFDPAVAPRVGRQPFVETISQPVCLMR